MKPQYQDLSIILINKYMKGVHNFIEKLLENGSIEVTCEKCDYHHVFDNKVSADRRNIYGCEN